MRRIVAFSLLFFIIVSSSFSVFANYVISNDSYIQNDYNHITREEAVALFIRSTHIETNNAKTDILNQFHDSSKVSSAYMREMATAVALDFISGYSDGTLRPQEKISRVEALVILNRILGNRTLPSHIELIFIDTPAWAEEDISRLTKAGIIQGYGDGSMGASDYLSREQANLLAQRVARMIGPTGDFYEYTNESWLNDTSIPDGYNAWSDFHQITQKTMKENGEIIYSINRQKKKDGIVFPAGSSEQKIADLFAAGSNTVYRDKLGLSPVAEYLDSIENCKNSTDLLKVMAELELCGFHGLFPLSIEKNALNSSQYILTFSGCYTGKDASFRQGDNVSEYYRKYQSYLADLFTLFGFDEPNIRAKNASNLCMRLEKTSLSMEEKFDLKKNYHVLNTSEIKDIFSHFDTTLYFNELGFSSSSSLACYDITLAKEINLLLKNVDLDVLKDYLRASVMDTSALYLNTDVFLLWQGFQNDLYGTNMQSVPADYAVQFVEEFLPWDLASIYVDKYASSSAKEAVESITKKILSAYCNRVRVNTWMSNESKNAALKKLDSIQINVGYPDNIKDYIDPEYEIKPIKDGGNILAHRIAFKKQYYRRCVSLAENKSPNTRTWKLLPQTVNAMYEPSTNSITIPAAMLTPPFYDPDASLERNLGGIGFVIAHEISHALDDTGSQYDENGNLNPWWQPEDEKAFLAICQEVETAYSAIEPLPGIHIDGKLTLSENIADLAGMSCLLDVVGAGNPRLDELFMGYATIWRNKSTPTHTHKALETDTHSPDKIRVNRVLANFDVFQEFYQILPTDGMYLPKEKQIQIWNR